jgi:hypothetical protein
MRLSGWNSFPICLLLALGGASSRAEFPPDTFPEETPQAAPQRDGSYEENEAKAAEEEYLAPKKRRQTAPPSSQATEPPTEDEGGTPAPRRRSRRSSRPALHEESEPTPFERRLTLSAFGGLLNFTSSNPSADALIARIFINSHITMGLMADFQFSKYFGADFDGYYGFSNAQSVETSPSVFETRQITELGTLMGVRAEYPITLNKVVLRPRVFIGYGIMNNSQISGTTSGNGSLSIQVTGIYAGGGLETEFATIVRAFFDYSTSINTSATESLGGISGSSSNSASPSGFQRLRFGLNGRFFDHFWLGGMVVIRGQGSGVLTDAASNRLIGETNTMTSFLATVGVAL